MANITPTKKNPMGKPVSSGQRIMIINSYKMELTKNPKLTVREARIHISKQLGIGQRTVSNVISEYNTSKTVTSPSKTRNKPSFKDKLDQWRRTPTNLAVQNYSTKDPPTHLSTHFRWAVVDHPWIVF